MEPQAVSFAIIVQVPGRLNLITSGFNTKTDSFKKDSLFSIGITKNRSKRVQLLASTFRMPIGTNKK